MPAQAVAKRAEPELFALPIVLQHVAIVAGRPKEVEANPVAPPMRRAFEPGLEETGECLAHAKPLMREQRN
jgi:hypothetical protein